MPTVLIDTLVQHASETRGIVVTRRQLIEIDGMRFEALYWSDFASGKLHHIESRPSVDAR